MPTRRRALIAATLALAAAATTGATASQMGSDLFGSILFGQDGPGLNNAVACADRIVVATVEEIHHAADWFDSDQLADREGAGGYREAVAIVQDVWKGPWTRRVVFRATAADGGPMVRLNERVLLFLSGHEQAALSTACLGSWAPLIQGSDEGPVVSMALPIARDPRGEAGPSVRASPLEGLREKVRAFVELEQD